MILAMLHLMGALAFGLILSFSLIMIYILFDELKERIDNKNDKQYNF